MIPQQEKVPIRIDIVLVTPSQPGEAEGIQSVKEDTTHGWRRRAGPVFQQGDLHGRTEESLHAMQSRGNDQDFRGFPPWRDRDIECQLVTLRAQATDRLGFDLPAQMQRGLTEPFTGRSVVW